MKTILLIITVLAGLTVQAQNILAIDKTHGTKRIRYYEGHPVKFELKNGMRIGGKISAVGDSSVFIGSHEILLSDINSVIRKRSFFAFMSYLKLSAAAVLLPANLISNGLNDRKIINTDTYIIAACTLGSGLIFYAFSEKKMKIGKKYRLNIINM